MGFKSTPARHCMPLLPIMLKSLCSFPAMISWEQINMHLIKAIDAVNVSSGHIIRTSYIRSMDSKFQMKVATK